MCFWLLIYFSISGSYGGRGGSPANTFLTRSDAVAYGSFVNPLSTGSPGGGGFNAGRGGGAILLNATNSIEVNGIISANGGHASGTTAVGGGSGGSIYLEAPVIRGSGVVSARGGNGAGNGGGGGGGRITIKHSSWESMVEVFADGGLGGKRINVNFIRKEWISSNLFKRAPRAPDKLKLSKRMFTFKSEANIYIEIMWNKIKKCCKNVNTEY